MNNAMWVWVSWNVQSWGLERWLISPELQKKLKKIEAPEASKQEIVKLFQEEEVKNAQENPLVKWPWYKEKVSLWDKLEQWNESVTYKNWDIRIRAKKDWTCIPLAIQSDWKWDEDGKKEGDKVSAVQEFDPKAPWVVALTQEVDAMVDKAESWNIITKNPTDPDYINFRIYAANKAIEKKLWKTQDETAYKAQIEKVKEQNWWVAKNSDIEGAGAEVCTYKWAFLAHNLVANDVNADMIARKSEKHLFAVVDIPWEWEKRVDAWVNTSDILESKGVQQFELMEQLYSSN